MFYSEGNATFQLASPAGICQGTFEIVSKEVLWSVQGSYQTIWGPPFPNVTWHSGGWPSRVTPSIDQTLHQFLTLLLISTLLPNLTFYLTVRGFHRTFATGALCQHRTLTPPDTWSRPTLGLACVIMLRPISPGLVLFLLSFEHPSVLLFCFQGLIMWCTKVQKWWPILNSMSRLRPRTHDNNLVLLEKSYHKDYICPILNHYLLQWNSYSQFNFLLLMDMQADRVGHWSTVLGPNDTRTHW